MSYKWFSSRKVLKGGKCVGIDGDAESKAWLGLFVALCESYVHMCNENGGCDCMEGGNWIA